jgi:hypothetical protein
LRTISIGHLSHGTSYTGGYLLEQNLLKELAQYLTKDHYPITQTIRAGRVFKGLAHFNLLWWAFIHTRFDINIVVARCALSAILRNLFTTRKTVIVLHYFDERDRKGLSLKIYYSLLFFFLRRVKHKNVSICAVAPYWVDYFKEKVNHKIPVFLYPNLFDNSKYKSYQTIKKKKQVHLGQYSSKNDEAIFRVATQLTALGYVCYFTTLLQEEEAVYTDYEVRYVPFEKYLSDMAESEYTLAYIRINEGWNRIAHESILVGTDVIGVNKGGLGNLLIQSGSLVADTEQDFVNLIKEQRKASLNPEFVSMYDCSNAARFIHPILKILELA